MNATFGSRLVTGFVCVLSAFVIGATGEHVTLAANACNEPTGSLSLTLLANSDTFVSIPFTTAPLFCGTVQSVSGNAVTVQGAPAWATGQWSQMTGNGYFPNYVVLTSGTKEGATFSITNNSSDTLVLVAGCDDLSGVNAGDQLAVLPYWTLGTTFPGGSGITPSTSPLAAARKTQVLLPLSCPTCSGIPSAGADTYFFYNSHWRKVGAPAATSFDDVVILPDQFFIVRQSNNSPTTILTTGGNIVQYSTRTCLNANSTTTNWDNYVANYHSTTQTLDQASLAAAFTASNPGAANPAINDLLLVYDNTAMKMNKAPAHVYFYDIDHWADLNNPPYTINRGADPVFVPGTGVTVRKRPGSTQVWVISP
ncbi:MAG: TIGR02597 family protein [Verrucomicrobiia bacterium]|jgi:uncharacterized protein (TIGR02597 family)